MRDLHAYSVALLLTSIASQAAAQTSDDERARTHFDAGRLHYEEGAYDRALVEFEAAWELSHRPELLLNLATVRERLAQYSQAAEHLEQYLAMRPDDENRPRYERRVANLRRLADQRGDGEPVAADPAITTGAAAASRGGGASISPIGPILLGVGGAALIVAAIVGGVAVAEDSSVRDRCAMDRCPAELRDDADGVEALAVATDALWITGALIAATGLVLTFVLTDGDDAASARLGVGPGGVQLRGAF